MQVPFKELAQYFLSSTLIDQNETKQNNYVFIEFSECATDLEKQIKMIIIF